MKSQAIRRIVRDLEVKWMIFIQNPAAQGVFFSVHFGYFVCNSVGMCVKSCVCVQSNRAAHPFRATQPTNAVRCVSDKIVRCAVLLVVEVFVCLYVVVSSCCVLNGTSYVYAVCRRCSKMMGSHSKNKYKVLKCMHPHKHTQTHTRTRDPTNLKPTTHTAVRRDLSQAANRLRFAARILSDTRFGWVVM